MFALVAFKTVMGACTAPTGAVTVRLLTLADVTVAFVAPKKTILLAAVASKLAPAIITVAPMSPLIGENDVMTGTCAKDR